jgi:sugar lactone lactonase YvrE
MLSLISWENVSTIGGAGDIYVKLLPDGDPVRLTHDRRNKMTPVFTPTSDRIAYGVHNLMTDPTSWSTWTVSIFGGEPQPLLSNASALTWIRDASPPRILFSGVDAGIHMSIVTSAENRTESRTVYSPDSAGGMAHRSFLSPDRKHVLIVEMDTAGWRPCRLVPFEREQGKEAPAGKAVGPFPGQCSSAAWSPDGQWMYFSINTGDGYHIWRQRFPDGTPEQVTFGATEEHDIIFAPDGQSFYTSVGTRQSTLWVHDARGDRQISFEGYAMLPSFSPDGKKIYYLLRSRENRRYMSGELWSSNLETGQRERLLRNFVVEHYSISPDGNRVLFVALSEEGDSRLWLGRLDGRTAPRRLSDVRASRAFFGADGEILFSGEEDGGRFLYRVKEDGSGLHKAIPKQIAYVYDVSPDGKAVAAWPDGPVQLLPINGGLPEIVSMVCAATGGENRGTTPPCVSWSPNGRFLYLNDRSAGQIYAVPIPPGQRLPRLPAGGVKSAEEATAIPGARVIRERYAFIGSDPSVYAFFRVTSQRNIYRIRVP